jgi:hypothetical protein
VDTLHIQMLFERRVAGSDADGWTSVAIASDPATAYRHAATAFHALHHPTGGRALGVRVVTEERIKTTTGERGLRRAQASIFAVAMALERAAA